MHTNQISVLHYLYVLSTPPIPLHKEKEIIEQDKSSIWFFICAPGTFSNTKKERIDCSTNQDEASAVTSREAGIPATSFNGFHLYFRLQIEKFREEPQSGIGHTFTFFPFAWGVSYHLDQKTGLKRSGRNGLETAIGMINAPTQISHCPAYNAWHRLSAGDGSTCSELFTNISLFIHSLLGSFHLGIADWLFWIVTHSAYPTQIW